MVMSHPQRSGTSCRCHLVVENGLGLEPWADRFLRAAGMAPLTLSQGMEPLLIEGDAYAGKPNPHAWMSPQRAMGYVDGLVAGFSQLDPEGAAEFRRNGANYKQQLQHLDQELRSALASYRHSNGCWSAAKERSPIWPRLRPRRGLSLACECGKPSHAKADGAADHHRQERQVPAIF